MTRKLSFQTFVIVVLCLQGCVDFLRLSSAFVAPKSKSLSSRTSYFLEQLNRPKGLVHRRGSIGRVSLINLSSGSSESDVKEASADVAQYWFPSDTPASILEPPLNNLVDATVKSVIYEAELGRDLGFEIAQGEKSPIVRKVQPKSKAAELGIKKGDIIVATSATAGEQLWSHESADSVKSALRTRFVMSTTVKMRFERALDDIDESLIDHLMVPYYTTVRLKRPIGLHVVEGAGQAVYVQYIKPNLGAARSKRVELGDQIIAMSASWGDRMWDVHSVESFVVGVRMRGDESLKFRLKRMVPFRQYTGQVLDLQNQQLIEQRSREFEERAEAMSKYLGWDANALRQRAAAAARQYDAGAGSSSAAVVNGGTGRVNNGKLNQGTDSAAGAIVMSRIKAVQGEQDFEDILSDIKSNRITIADPNSPNLSGNAIDSMAANRLMSKALAMERPDIAAEVFEYVFGFSYDNPTADLLDTFSPSRDGQTDRVAFMEEARSNPPLVKKSLDTIGNDSARGAAAKERAMNDRKVLPANNYVCTTAIKAYGRLWEVKKAAAVLPFLEEQQNGQPVADIYLLSSLLYVFAKARKVELAENMFWKEIPARGLSYTTATANSLMYMYAKMNKPDNALRVYDLIREKNMQVTVVTYGVLIKALLRSNRRRLQETAFEILISLPNMGIQPGVEVYNQFLEYYAKTCNFRQAKEILRLMKNARPRVKPTAITYGHIIECFANSRKSRSAISAFAQMRKRNIRPNGYTYMGVLKALTSMRDGLSSAQVIREMYDEGVQPDERHFSMAMFACVIANQCSVAESLINLYMRQGERPDSALCTLWLRALLQQGKWDEGLKLLEMMKKGKDLPFPDMNTYGYLLQYQILSQKWPEGSETLKLVLEKEKTRKMSSTANTLYMLFDALAYSLGMYSSEVMRRFRDDQTSVSYQLAGHMNTSAYSDEDFQVVVNSDGESNEPQSIRLRDAENIMAFNTLGGSEYLDGTLAKPTRASLRFALDAVIMIIEYPKAIIQTDFYMELLKACILEGQVDFAAELINYRKSGKIRLKLRDPSQLEGVENLAERAIQGDLTEKAAAGADQQ